LCCEQEPFSLIIELQGGFSARHSAVPGARAALACLLSNEESSIR